MICEVWVCACEVEAVRVTVNDRLFAEYPQPETHIDPAMNAAATASRNTHWAICDRFRVFARPSNEMNPHGMTQPKASVPPGTPCGLASASTPFGRNHHSHSADYWRAVGGDPGGIEAASCALRHSGTGQADRLVESILRYQCHSQTRWLPRFEVYAGRCYHHRVRRIRRRDGYDRRSRRGVVCVATVSWQRSSAFLAPGRPNSNVATPLAFNCPVPRLVDPSRKVTVPVATLLPDCGPQPR